MTDFASVLAYLARTVDELRDADAALSKGRVTTESRSASMIEKTQALIQQTLRLRVEERAVREATRQAMSEVCFLPC